MSTEKSWPVMALRFVIFIIPTLILAVIWTLADVGEAVEDYCWRLAGWLDRKGL